MNVPKTLLEMAGADLKPASLSKATLILIDMQNEYLQGALAVDNADHAIGSAKKLLAAARKAGTPVIHIAHAGRPDGPFDRSADRGQIVAELAPQSGELVIEKSLPNAFAGTDVHMELEKTGRKEIILAGFMTHMCVSSTARAAIDLGYRVTIDADASGTRDLPDGKGEIVKAETLHTISLAALADRFAIVTRDHIW